MNLNEYAAQSREDNDKWWHELICSHCGRKLNKRKVCRTKICINYLLPQEGIWAPCEDRNQGELLMLMVSELSEAMEGIRKGLMDDKLPHRTMEEVELADALIRIFDYAGNFGLDIEGAYQEKRQYNAQRHDHSFEARAAVGGKAF
jgi:hypothetical protein